MIAKVAVRVLVDMRVVQPDFTVFNAGESVADLALAGAEGLDLGAAEDDSRLERFEDVIVPAGLRIGHDLGHKQKRPEAGLSGRAQ
jgi:dUTPase